MGELLYLVGTSTLQTLLMVLFSTIFSMILGFPLGVLLSITKANGIMPRKVLNQVLSRVVNVLRSFPFIILMIVLFPLSRLIVGTSIGTAATIVPLSIAAAPFVARVIESALNEVNPDLVQAAKSMGSTNMQIILKVLIPEALPSLVDGVTLTIINLIGYSAMAGTLGGGGLGDIAIRYGHYRFQPTIMWITILVLIVIVQIMQEIGIKVAAKMDNRLN